MTTEIERLDRKSILVGGNLAHAQRLIAALGNPSEWEYRGIYRDLGKPSGTCACGHPGIRYEFLLHHDGRTAVVGSTCICHYALINPAGAIRMAADYGAIQQRLAAARLAAKNAAESAEIQAILPGYDALRAEMIALHQKIWDSGRESSNLLWRLAASFQWKIPSSCHITGTYKRTSTQKAKLLANMKQMREAIQEGLCRTEC